jgi:anti-sigma factor RsiW
MTCGEIKNLLSAYIDDELTLTECARINDHLAHCQNCEAELKSLQALRQRMRAPELHFKMPEGFEKRIFEAMPKESRSKSWSSVSVRDFFSIRNMGWVAALFIAVISVSHLHEVSQNPGDELAQEVVSEHLRSIKTRHLIEVVSTDQHTVKPWFNGKVDFSPNVKDLTSNGFPLTGGRVDYLGGHPVAAIVFQRRKHTINLFIWPEKDSHEANVQSFSINGYNIFKWSKEGFWYWAISDLNPTELTEFMQLYKK